MPPDLHINDFTVPEPAELGLADVSPLLLQLVSIGAPSGSEQRRAAFIAQWLEQAGVPNVRMDAVSNVIVRLGPPGKALMLDAHMDTVFPDETLAVDQRDDGRWFCPGILDNSVHCALLMIYLRWLACQGCSIPLLATFSVGEEGYGHLRGMKALLPAYADQVRWVIGLDLNRHQYSRRCVGSSRFDITFSAPGGHSWSAFGQPSAIHAAAGWVKGLEALADWSPDRLSYNVGLFNGGSGVTSIAASAQLQVEVRSVDPLRLKQTEADVAGTLQALADRPGDLKVQWKGLGGRPAGELPASHPLVGILQNVHQQQLNLPLEEGARSTNVNWPTHLGIPALCTGLASGGGAHSRMEFLDTTTLPLGLTKLATLVNAVRRQWTQT